MPVERIGDTVYRRLDQLKPYDRNARVHPPEQITKIRASLRALGFYAPVLLRDDEVTIGVGHGRVEAAMAEGHVEGPTIVLTGLTDEEWRALVIADNRLAEGATWNESILKLELGELAARGFEIGLTGFTLEDFGRPAGKDPNQAPPPPAVAASRRGDIWRCGSHLIMCGDATSRDDVEALLQGVAPGLTLTDPPYGIGFGYGKHDDTDRQANAELVAKVFALAPGPKCWTPGLMNLARDIGRFGETKVLVWHKGFAAAGNGLGGASTWEPVLVVAPKRRKLANDYLDFKTDREELGGKMLREHHPCPKPVALFTHLAEAFAPPGGRVYEPFSGSGTTIIACELAKRRCSAMEIDPAYVDVALMRWEGFSGEEATLMASGASFKAVRLDRLGPDKANP